MRVMLSARGLCPCLGFVSGGAVGRNNPKKECNDENRRLPAKSKNNETRKVSGFQPIEKIHLAAAGLKPIGTRVLL